MTHELIANLLGVRGEGVTKGAMRLRDAGLIGCARGHIAVLDRAGLKRRSCECHHVIRFACDRLLPTGPAQAEDAHRLRAGQPQYARIAA